MRTPDRARQDLLPNAPRRQDDVNDRRERGRTPWRLALAVFLVIAGYYLWFEHRVHVLGVLPLLLPLAICLGMHVFMHRGHHRHRGHRSDRDDT
jgi:hypothetical protein